MGACGQLKKHTNFYQSTNPIHKSTGKIMICKDCIKKMCLDKKSTIDIELVKKMLSHPLIDKPYIFEIFKSCLEKETDTIGNYFRQINSLHQYDGQTWKDSSFNPECEEYDQENADVLDKDLQEKYGYGFTSEEYLNFERKYKKMSRGYKEKTELHTERFLSYIIKKVKGEMATAAGHVAEAEKWEKLAQADATAAKININQISKSDITGGIDLLPQLVEAVETHASIISLLPKVLEQPYDDADMIIWANINYLRRLEDKPSISYREIWYFYDSMLEEFFKQKGFSDKQIQQERTKRNNVFRDLSEVYIEPLYENPDVYEEEEFGDTDEI
jgi:hypothetical protein